MSKDDELSLPPKFREAREQKRPVIKFIARSKMEVNLYDDQWVLLPNKNKGNTVDVGWVHSSKMPLDDKKVLLHIFQFYAESRAAATAVGVIHGLKPYFSNGILSLDHLKAVWGGLKINAKKVINSFFGAAKKHGYRSYSKHHNFTTNNLPKEKPKPFDIRTGALSEVEFDDLARQINERIRSFDFSKEHHLDFFRSDKFRSITNAIALKMQLHTTRRPKQISLMKWSDLIPVGSAFKQEDSASEVLSVGSIGSRSLQVRVFKVKENSGVTQERDAPERYPISLSEDFSRETIEYKLLYVDGLKRLIEDNNLYIDDREISSLMDDMPVFLAEQFFDLKFDSIAELKALFHSNSIAFHASASSIATAFTRFELKSDRVTSCVANSNRLRHTVLTRAAQDGMNSAQLSKITGVTEPATRHYIDLDYESRQMIDKKYIGNKFLKTAFNTFLSELGDNGELIYSSDFEAVGGSDSTSHCQTCKSKMGKPIGCYGCFNFRPILEADHKKVLEDVQSKLEINRKSLISPLNARSIEKLEKQIAFIKLTIELCEEIKLRESALDVE